MESWLNTLAIWNSGAMPEIWQEAQSSSRAAMPFARALTPYSVPLWLGRSCLHFGMTERSRTDQLGCAALVKHNRLSIPLVSDF